VITAIKNENIDAYKALFDEASDILRGYKRVRTYNADVIQYFRKNDKPTGVEDLFLPVENINSLKTFATALNDYVILYV
jgi:hypothetical protein